MINDSELRALVEEALSWEPSVVSTHVGVSCNNGVVTLSGHVSSWAEKWSAERATKRVRGLRGLADEIDVQLPTDRQHNDTDIAKAAVGALDWNAALPKDTIKVTVKDGCIELSGDVEQYYQRRVAEAAVRYLRGVRRVTNSIDIKPPVEAQDVKQAIARALERSAHLDADCIQVETSGHRVTLRGKVASWSEKDEAEEAAWAAPGVWHVDSQLSVSE